MKAVALRAADAPYLDFVCPNTEAQSGIFLSLESASRSHFS